MEATILKRYKRFLADVDLGDKTIVAHVPNTGSMQSCWEPNWKCALTLSKNPDRKLPHTVELIHNGESWIGVNTGNANKLAKLWLTQNRLPELMGYTTVVPEKKIGLSRIDFYLEGHATRPPCYVEVKNVTLKLHGLAQFPDSVSERGQKHLKELIDIKKSGLRAAMLYIVQRDDVASFTPAHTIDPQYAKLLKEAYQSGVEILVYQCRMGLQELSLGQALPFELN
ncbi:MAG: DNA/RNA nuclease SfsA [Bdellovibrionales bacterium]|nr:DNA/RNA nuclease SfsA [Bdellovibrionales bacterium]